MFLETRSTSDHYFSTSDWFFTIFIRYINYSVSSQPINQQDKKIVRQIALCNFHLIILQWNTWHSLEFREWLLDGTELFFTMLKIYWSGSRTEGVTLRLSYFSTSTVTPNWIGEVLPMIISVVYLLPKWTYRFSILAWNWVLHCCPIIVELWGMRKNLYIFIVFDYHLNYYWVVLPAQKFTNF